MKIKLLTLFLIIYGYSYSQTYIPILEEDNEWHVAYWAFWAGGYTHSNTFKVLGDEEINGKIYKIVYRNEEITSCRFREENGVLYSYQNGADKVILDFNVNIGAIIEEDFYCIGGAGGTLSHLEVIDIYTSVIAGEERKIIDLEGFDFFGDPLDYFEQWIEGIGSTSGIVPFGYNWDFYDDLSCFTKNGETTYFNGHTQCVYVLGIEDLPKTDIILHPNPVTSTSILQFSSEGIVDLLKIYNISGKLVKKETVDKDYVLIDAMQYRSGLYFYQVFSENELLKTEKFIIK